MRTLVYHARQKLSRYAIIVLVSREHVRPFIYADTPYGKFEKQERDGNGPACKPGPADPCYLLESFTVKKELIRHNSSYFSTETMERHTRG